MSSMRAMPSPTYSSPFADGKVAVRPIPAIESGAFARVPVMIGATNADLGGPAGPMIAGARRLAELISAYHVPVYYYRFSYEHKSEGVPASGARHASDVPFFLANAAVRYGNMTNPQDRAMSNVIGRYVANFAESGRPAAQDLPTWTAFNVVDRHMMEFTPEGTAIQGEDTPDRPSSMQ